MDQNGDQNCLPNKLWLAAWWRLRQIKAYLVFNFMTIHFHWIVFRKSFFNNFYLEYKGYIYSIFEKNSYNNKLRYFSELKGVNSYDYFALFSGCSFGDKILLNTDNNRYLNIDNNDSTIKKIVIGKSMSQYLI